LQRGEHERAQRWTQQLLYLNVDHGYPIRFLPINVCLAYIEYQQGRISAAFRRLNDSLTQAEATGMLTGLLDDIPGLDDFVKQALDQQRILNPQQVKQLHALGILDLAQRGEPHMRATQALELSDAALHWHQRNLQWYQDQATPDFL
jgi:hypothetical protein